MKLFQSNRSEPLAWRMQPGSLDEFVGQSHIIGEGKPYLTALVVLNKECLAGVADGVVPIGNCLPISFSRSSRL